MRRPGLVALAVYLAFGLLWSWPLVLSPASSTLSLHFDQLPAAWLVHAAPTFVPDGVSELSAWPAGEPLARLDSFLFLLVAIGLWGALPGLLVTNLFVLLGPPVTAWAAERFARVGLGVPAPASWAAGFAFGFAPLATVAALEGHVYYLLDPWLPLAALAAWQGRPGRAALHFGLALLTTAYLGIATLVVIGAVLALRRRLDLRLLAGVGAVGLAYAVLFLAGASSAPGGEEDALVRVGAATLTTLVAWTPWMDLARHSLAPALGVAPFALALLSPWAPLPTATRGWLALGLGCAVLALGPAIEAGVAHGASWPGPLWPLLKLGVFDWFRFPIRLGWVSALAFGVLAAGVAARARFGPALVGLVALDALFGSGAAYRLRPHPTPTPSLYAALPDGPLLELYPESGGPREDLRFYQQNLSCYYQLFHRRPLLEKCLNTDMRRSPRAAAARDVHDRLFRGEAVLPALAALRVRSVVLHADLYQPHERAELSAALTGELGAPSREGHDGGEWLLAWEVP